MPNFGAYSVADRPDAISTLLQGLQVAATFKGLSNSAKQHAATLEVEKKKLEAEKAKEEGLGGLQDSAYSSLLPKALKAGITLPEGMTGRQAAKVGYSAENISKMILEKENKAQEQQQKIIDENRKTQNEIDTTDKKDFNKAVKSVGGVEKFGWTPTESISRDETELRSFKGSVAEQKSFNDLSDELTAELERVDKLPQVQKMAELYLPGKTKTKIDGLIGNLQLKSKNDSFQKLGVLAGPDVGFINKGLPNVTERNAEGLITPLSAQIANIKSTKASFNNNLLSKGQVLGFRPSAAAYAAAGIKNPDDSMGSEVAIDRSVPSGLRMPPNTAQATPAVKQQDAMMELKRRGLIK